MPARPLPALLLAATLAAPLIAPVGSWARQPPPPPAPATTEPSAPPPRTPGAATPLARAQALAQSGKLAEAEALLRDLTRERPGDAHAWMLLGFAIHSQGRHDEALPIHERAAALGQGPILADALYNAACVHALRGRPDRAFEVLRSASLAGMRDLAQLSGDPDLASLRADPRFADHLAAVKAMTQHPPEKALHFWAGSWDCYARGGKAGTNTLELRLGGAAILERWTDAAGNPGESWNVFDPSDGTWRQTWVQPGGRITTFSGTPDAGGIRFAGVVTSAAGDIERVTMFVRPIGEGRIRQTGGAFDASGTLRPRYDLFYVPAGTPFDPAAFDWDAP